MSIESAVDNILFLTDSYKVSHSQQYPPGTTSIYSYFESRGGLFDETVFFGLQYILKRWLLGVVVTDAKIDEAKQILQAHFGKDIFNESGWRYIVKAHNGHLPLRIKAVPEGTVVPVKNVLITVENTDPQCFWLTNYIETLLVQVWYPITVATISRQQKKIIARYLNETADNSDGLLFKLHDFGYRGSTSVESAAIGGAAHLVNFWGTDTLAGIMMAKKYYNASMPGFSIPASEHSTITSWGREHELDAFANMLDQYPTGLVACVSDSYNIYEACSELWGTKLKDKILSRDGTLVIRPDSGDPATVVVQVLTILGEKFGYTVNSKGYKMLPPQLRVIQGDGISYITLELILQSMKNNQWSADNVVFGSGGALLQKMDRDTQKCAFKCSYAVIHSKGVPVYKDPITDNGKKSKQGRLALIKSADSGLFCTQEYLDNPPKEDALVLVYENGVLKHDYAFDEVRSNARL